MKIYDRIRLLTKERGITITGMEKELGFARGSLSKIDAHKPSNERIEKIAHYLNVSVDWLYGRTKDRTATASSAPNPELTYLVQDMYTNANVIMDIYQSKDRDKLIEYAKMLKLKQTYDNME